MYTWGEPADTGRRGDHRIPGRVLGIPWNQAIIKVGIPAKVTMDISGSLIENQWGSQKYPG